MSTGLLQTPLHKWHVENGATLADFAGWSMPIQYAAITAEHNATRTETGLFDISHMGRLRVDGGGAAAFLDGLVTRRVADMQPGQVRYALVTNERGGVLDDVLVYCLADGGGTTYFLVVVNASNRDKILAWFRGRLPASGVQLTDVTNQWAMVAVQGPTAAKTLGPLVDLELTDMPYYSAQETRVRGHGGIVSRTGYTGEDGWEVLVGSSTALGLWQELLDEGGVPAGLGARDTLRLEAGMPLYGHELTEAINPYQAGLGFAVNLEDREFVGRAALAELRENAVLPRRVGVELAGKRVPREGHAVCSGGKQVGQVTSGTYAPTLLRPIAMAYVQPACAALHAPLQVDVRGKFEAAKVVALPFYRRQKGAQR